MKALLFKNVDMCSLDEPECPIPPHRADSQDRAERLVARYTLSLNLVDAPLNGMATLDGIEREVTTQIMRKAAFVETVLDVTLGDEQRFPIRHSEF